MVKTLIGVSAALAVIFIFLSLTENRLLSGVSPYRNPSLPQAISHAFGEIDGITYTNSLEAFRQHYENGCRFFEVDFWMTPEGKAVAFHDGFEDKFSLKKGFSWQEFMGAKIAGKYTPMDSEKIAEFMAKFPDWFIVTDVKNDQEKVLADLCYEMRRQKIDCRKRLVPQIYNIQADFEAVSSQGFEQIILTLYRTDAKDKEILEFVKKTPSIVAVTATPSRANPDLVTNLRKKGVKTYVHTINDPKQAQEYMNQGLSGVYTDRLCRGI